MSERTPTRRGVIRAGAGVCSVGLAGCRTASSDAPLTESFESDLDGWTTHSDIGPEEPEEAFEWAIERSETQAADGDWSLEVFTEGDHDDGTAWATTELEPPADADSFSVSFQAWSQSESFNILRNVVAYLGPEEPREEGDFPDPGGNSSAIPDAPYGGLREPLHLSEGWHEYSFDWDPDSVPETLFFAVGVSVVWESDATHYLDDIEIDSA